MNYELIDNSAGLSDVPGYQLAGVGCDVRCTGNLERMDLALVVSERPCVAAGVFTTHDLPAAPVRLCRELLADGQPLFGFVANSGNANACTGALGMSDAQAMVRLACEAVGVPTGRMLVCSTGRIGRALPMEHLERGIGEAAQSLGTGDAQGQAAAWAILTSDTRPKTCTATIEVGGQRVTLAGMAKGAGMIEPNMATMLAFITSDAQMDSLLLKRALSEAVSGTFNAITVDGDMSTNDTVLLFANGVSGVSVEAGSQAYADFVEALTAICANLAKKIVKDGERVTKCVELRVEGAKSAEDAERVARAVANSLLVKTSWFGNDPNWGRLADAAGYARAGIVEERLDIHYDDVPALLGGVAQDDRLSEWKAVVSRSEFCITLDLNLGEGSYRLLTTDLTEGYVNFNKSE